jgi:hypothetical protein
MQAEKWVLETDAKGELHGLPVLPPNTKVEVILLFTPTATTTHPKRKPPAELAGQVKILGDIIIPAVSPEDWDAYK